MLTKYQPVHKLPVKALNRVKRTEIVRQILTPFGKELNPERWIFIVGCYNSGTTLLARILAKHPEIAALPIEGVFLTDALPYPEKYGWPRMWCQCMDKIRFMPGPGMEALAKRAKKQWSLWYPRDGNNLLEKSVANTARMLFLQEYFKPAYFIYIVRNGYAVAGGIREKADLKRWKNPRYTTYPIELCAEQWRVTDELVEQDCKQIERFFLVKYEELTENPEQILPRITKFLGLPPLPTEVLTERWRVSGIVSSIRNMNDRSFQRLSAGDIEAITRVAKPILEKYKYEPPLKYAKADGN